MTLKPSEGRMRITEVNPHLICALCGGYLIDATTIVECLHSFCKTCIMRYLETSKYCPICEVLIHKTRPWQNIRLDDTLQNIVYKLVPGLFQREMQRRRDYYSNQPVPAKSHGKTKSSGRIIFSADEEFSISLEFWPEGPNSPETECDRKSCDKLHDRRYLLCPAAVNMSHLKRFIRNKYSLSDRYQIDIYHTNQPLRDNFSLVDVAYIYSWRREGILRLFYAFYLNEAKKMKFDLPEDQKQEVTSVEEMKVEEPDYLCKDVIFEKGISIIETEKIPLPTPVSTSLKPAPILSNGEAVTAANTPVQTQPPALPAVPEVEREEQVVTETDDFTCKFDDDDDEESEMHIVMDESENVDDSESNLEIIIEEKPKSKPAPISDVTKPEVITQPKERVVNTAPPPSILTKSPDVKEKETTNQDRANNNKSSPEKPPSTNETKTNHSEPLPRIYTKITIPKSPIKESISPSPANSKPSYKDSSLQIARSTAKDTASQIVMSSQKDATNRPAPSPIKEMTYRYPMTSQPEKKDSGSPRLVMTSSKDSSPSSNRISQAKKESVAPLPVRPSLIKESSSQRSLPSPGKDSVTRPVLSQPKEQAQRCHSVHHSKDPQRPATSHSVSSHSVTSSKESFQRPLASPKKESYGHMPTSQIRSLASHHHALISGKDMTSRISNSTVKETAAQVGKHSHHKDNATHSHSIKSMIKESSSSPSSSSSSSPMTSHIKHVPQVPRLVKTPIQQLKPPTSEPYSTHPPHSPHSPHNINTLPKWQPHRDGYYNGHYKPPQEKPLELKREPVPLDYSKPS